MMNLIARKFLGTVGALAVLGCLAAVTGAALLAVQHTKWDWLTLLLSAVLTLLMTTVVWFVLDLVDKWIERAERARRAQPADQP